METGIEMYSVNPKKIIGFTSGYFDVMHRGHAMMLQECKRYCDYLIVAVHSNKVKTLQPDGRVKLDSVWSIEDRVYMVSMNKFVDEVVVYDGEEELYQYLIDNKDIINVRIIGEDHKGKPYTGQELPIPVTFNSRKHSYSSTNIINEIIQKRS